MRNLIFLFFVCLVISCKSSVPKNILPQDKMQTVMWEMMQADAMAEYYSSKDSTLSNLEKHVNYYQKILTLHHLTKEDFKKSLSYYQNHPSKLKPIFDSLQAFTERSPKTDTIKKQLHPVIPDSVRKKMVSSL